MTDIIKKGFFILCSIILLVVTMNMALAVNDSFMYWSFDDTNISGSNPLDLSGNGRDGTTGTVTTGSEGLLGEAFGFNGIGDSVTLPWDFSTSFSGTTKPYTVAMWIKTTTPNESAVFGDNDRNRFWINDGGTADNTRFQVYSGAQVVSIDLNDGGWHFVVFGYNLSHGVYSVDNSAYTKFTSGAINTNNQVRLGVRGTDNTKYYSGLIDELAVYNRSLSASEINALYNGGAGYNPYAPAPATVINNFSTIETSSFSFETPISISTTYGTINSITINSSDNDEVPYYVSSSFSTFGEGIADVTATCRISVDGSPVVNSTRTISVGDYGNFKLISTPFNLSYGLHTIITECTRDGVSASNRDFVVNNSQMTQFHLFDSNTNTSVNTLTLNNPTGYSLTTTPTLLDTFTISTGNVTNTTNGIDVVAHGRASYNYDQDGDITTYLVNDNNGDVCGNYTRGGSLGSVGSVGTTCLFQDLDSNTDYNFSFYGFTSVGTGDVTDLLINVYELHVNDTASNNMVLNKVVPAGVDTLVSSVNISNHLGGAFNVFADAGIMVNSNSAQDAYFYISNSEDSIRYYRTLPSTGTNGNINGQFVFTDSGASVKTYELRAYCPSGCNISQGDFTAFVTDAESVSTGTFIINAYNSYNDSEILVFNASIGGTTYTTTNGSVIAIGQGSQNVVITSQNHFINTSLHDTSTNLNASLKPYTEFRALTISGTVILSYTVNTSSDSYTTSNGVAYLPLLSDSNVSFTGVGYANNLIQVGSVQYYNISVFSTNSIRINIFDGISSNYLSQLTTISVINEYENVVNTTSNGTIILSLLEPSNYELRFVSNGYLSQSVFLTVNENSTQAVNIYMIVNDSSTLQRVQVLSLEGAILEGAVVRLQEQVIGQPQQYYTIDEKSTNSEGITAFYVNKSVNNYYRFIVVYEGVVRLTTVPTFFIPNIDEIIILNIPTSSSTGVDIDGLGVTTSFTRTGTNSETVNYQWIDANNEITGGRMIIKVRDFNISSPAEILYDSGVVTGFTGKINYTLPLVNDTEFIVSTYIVLNTFETQIHDVNIVFGTTVSIERNSGLLLALAVFLIVILLTVSFGALFSGILGFISLLGLSLIGVITFPIAIITSFIALIFIVFVKIKSGGN